MIFQIFRKSLFGLFGPLFGPSVPPDPENPNPYPCSFDPSYFRPDPIRFDPSQTSPSQTSPETVPGKPLIDPPGGREKVAKGRPEVLERSRGGPGKVADRAQKIALQEPLGGGPWEPLGGPQGPLEAPRA